MYINLTSSEQQIRFVLSRGITHLTLAKHDELNSETHVGYRQLHLRVRDCLGKHAR